MDQIWTLENFYQGGSESPQFAAEFRELEEGIHHVLDLPLKEAILALQELSSRLETAQHFITCLTAQNVGDLKAKELEAKVTELEASFAKANVRIDGKLRDLSEEEFSKLLSSKELKEISFAMEERRYLAKKRLDEDKESLIEDLAIDGYHGWSQFYSSLVGSLTFPFRSEELYQGQIENCFGSSERSVRQEAFRSYLGVYEQKAEQFAACLNHLGGFRNKMYGARGWDNSVSEPCDLNRILPETLEAMWDSVASMRAPLVDYLKQKAELLGVENIAWYDLEAPLGKQKSEISYDEGASLILRHFNKVSPKMGAYSKKLLENNCVDAEDRKGKAPGGFCVNFPTHKETRIFMTYSNTMTNVTVLAHELGHAFHAECCFSLPYFSQQYRMNVAETASTMAEMIVMDGAFDEVKDTEEKLSILDDKLSRSVVYLMNLHARFLFETRFYEERKKGYLLPEQISSLMLQAQKEAYADSLSEYHPLFWASKLHFYFTGVPFYNFPYTFGYLFSLGIYTCLMQEPKTFETRYIALLQDTAKMSTEALAKKHLGVDLSKPDFWQNALGNVQKDVQKFLMLTNSLGAAK